MCTLQGLVTPRLRACEGFHKIRERLSGSGLRTSREFRRNFVDDLDSSPALDRGEPLMTSTISASRGDTPSPLTVIRLANHATTKSRSITQRHSVGAASPFAQSPIQQR